MPRVGLHEAARLVGRNPATIHRAMQSGRLPYAEDNAGLRRIDTDDLFRLYGAPDSPAMPAQPATQRPKQRRSNAHAQRIAQLEAEVAAERQRNADLQSRIDEQAATIADLRRRLDDSEAERRTMVNKWRWWKRWLSTS